MENSFVYKGYTIQIIRDELANSPLKERTFYGTFSCYHDKYDLSSPNNRFKDDMDGLRKHIQAGHFIYLPIYLLDHSGISIKTTSYNDPWDSGLLGFIWVEKIQVRKDINLKKIPAKTRKEIQDLLQTEVELLNDYLIGNVYGYIVLDAKGNEIDSVWGFYGNPEKSGILDSAKNMVNFDRKNKRVKNRKSLKNSENEIAP